MKRFIADHAALLLLAALCLALGLYLPGFRNPVNLRSVAVHAAVLGVVALGQLLVVITGGIDLSVGGVAALAGAAGCLSMVHAQTGLSSALVHGWMMKLPHAVEPYLTDGVFPALVLAAGIAAGVLAGFGCGMVNGLLCARGGARPFLVTLGMMVLARGLAVVLLARQPVSEPPRAFAWLGGTPAWWVPVVIACGFGAAIVFLLAYTQFGRNLYAVGGNAEASRLSGILVNRVRATTFILSGTLAGFAGMMLASQAGTALSDAAPLYELDAIAACVIGGAGLAGGMGGAAAVLAGALVMGVLYSFCGIMGIPSDGQKALLGALLVSLVCYDGWCRRGAGILKD